MAWEVRLTGKAKKDLAAMDPQNAQRVLRFLEERVARLDDPRSIGDSLKSPEFGDFWKYRVGDYRIIAKIEDQIVSIVVVRVGNRREVYR